jgi:hypothetical protein
MFIFRDNKTIEKSKCLIATNEIYCHSSYSMTLGANHNFYIHPSACHTGTNSYIDNSSGNYYESILDPNNSNARYNF